MEKKKAIQSKELMKLFESSNRTYEEVVEFLKSWNGDQAGDKDHPEKTGEKTKVRRLSGTFSGS